jgi:hypothetical protein
MKMPSKSVNFNYNFLESIKEHIGDVDEEKNILENQIKA